MNGSNKARLGCESLEARENPAIGVAQVAGVLTVTSDNASDSARVVNAPFNSVQVQRFVGGAWVNVGAAHFGVNQIRFFGNGGNDYFANDTARPLFADGGSGDDRIYGGSANDVIRGGAGNDVLSGRDGNDYMYGGDGDDVLIGGDGNDRLYGEAGRDRLYGGNGNDVLVGGPDLDPVLDGGPGIDQIFA